MKILNSNIHFLLFQLFKEFMYYIIYKYLYINCEIFMLNIR